MALQGPFFGKRDGEQPLSSPRPPGGTFGAANPTPPASAMGSIATPRRAGWGWQRQTFRLPGGGEKMSRVVHLRVCQRTDLAVP
jgi:hypothetical protein